MKKSICLIEVDSMLAHKKFGRGMLSNYVFNKIKGIDEFDKIVIYSNLNEIKEYIEIINDNRFEYTSSEFSYSDVIKSYSDYDLFFFMNLNTPLLKRNTIKKCFNIIENNTDKDCILTASKDYSKIWIDKKPFYKDNKKPIIKETTGLYVITKDALIKSNYKIGDQPYFCFVTDEEALNVNYITQYRNAKNVLWIIKQHKY